MLLKRSKSFILQHKVWSELQRFHAGNEWSQSSEVSTQAGKVKDQDLTESAYNQRLGAAKSVSFRQADPSLSKEGEAQVIRENNALLALASAVATALPRSHFPMSEVPWPYYFIATRDSFTFKLVTKSQVSPRKQLAFSYDMIMHEYRSLTRPHHPIHCTFLSYIGRGGIKSIKVSSLL